MKKEWCREFMRKTFVFLILMLMWVTAYWITRSNNLIPSPKDVFFELMTIINNVAFRKAILCTFVRVVSGFTIGIVLGIVLSLLMVSKMFLDDLFSPMVLIVQSIPVVAFITLLLFWLKSEYVPVVVIILTVCPLVVRNLKTGIQATYNKKLFSKSTVKNVKPYLFASCRSGVAFAFKSGIAAEVLAKTDFSIGMNILEAKISDNITLLFSWIVVVVTMSFIFDFLSVSIFKIKQIHQYELLILHKKQYMI